MSNTFIIKIIYTYIRNYIYIYIYTHYNIIDRTILWNNSKHNISTSKNLSSTSIVNIFFTTSQLSILNRYRHNKTLLSNRNKEMFTYQENCLTESENFTTDHKRKEDDKETRTSASSFILANLCRGLNYVKHITPYLEVKTPFPKLSFCAFPNINEHSHAKM